MTRSMSIGGIVTATSILASSAAFADVSAEAVWGDWVSYMEGVGYTISSSSDTMSGNVKTISDLKAVFPIPEGEGTVSVDVGTVTLTENSDGSVAIVMPPTYQMVITSAPASDDFTLSLNFEQSGMNLVASGDDTETTYGVNMPSMKITLDEFTADGETIPAVLDWTISGYRGNYIVSDGDTTQVSGNAEMDNMAIDFDLNVPAEEVAIDVAVTMADLAAEIKAALPETFDQENMAANFDAGFAVEGNYSIGAITADVSGMGDGDSFAMKSTVGSAHIGFVMNGETMGVAELAKDVDITVSGSEIPFPEVNIKAAEYGLNFRMPVSKSEEPGDFATGIRVVDLEVTDMIWGMFDPAAVLPRDPATVIVDMTGKANWLANIMNPEEAAMMGMDGPPGELHAMNLNELQVSIAGVDLTGSGAFTFDNSDLVSFDGVPRPEGSVDLALNGANGLLDKLVTMGFVPEDQAMGARMMMGLFAVAGEGEDSLTSKIEVNSEGHVLANGQRLK